MISSARRRSSGRSDPTMHFIAELFVQRLREPRPALDRPFLAALRRADDERRERRSGAPRRTGPARRARPRSRASTTRSVAGRPGGRRTRGTARTSGGGTRRDPLVRDQPVELARAPAIESDLARAVEERGDEARLRVDLEIDHEIEAATVERAGELAVGAATRDRDRASTAGRRPDGGRRSRRGRAGSPTRSRGRARRP